MAELEFGEFLGEVRGFVGDKYTQNITPANVFVKIVIPGKKKPFSPYSPAEMKELKNEFPGLYGTLLEAGVLDVHPTDGDGWFQFSVPLGSWGYLVCAFVEEDEYLSKGKLIIRKDDFEKSKDRVVYQIVPVKDKWWKVTKGTRKGDPKTDPKTVPSGIISEIDYDKIENHRKGGT